MTPAAQTLINFRSVRELCSVHTFWFERKVLNLLRAWHELGVDVQLAASARDEVTVLQR